MVRQISIGAVAALMLLTILAVGADEKTWFDMENCSMCMHVVNADGLMEHMTWEQEKISNGMITVSTVEPDYMGKFNEMNEKMDQTAEKLMAGEKLYLCGSCEQFGSFIMRGANMEPVALQNGEVMLLTSDNEDMVAEMHAYVDKCKAEMAKMMPPSENEK